jgi:diguanylate cyclase (GGDEF)-like protein/PAS domain S-box-containing protein
MSRSFRTLRSSHGRKQLLLFSLATVAFSVTTGSFIIFLESIEDLHLPFWIKLTGAILQNGLLAAILWFIDRRLSVRPIQSLARGIMQMEERTSESQRLIVPPGHEEDEIGMLADTINLLIAETEARSQSLRESEERLRMLIDSMQDIICFKDGEGRWLVANQSDLRLFAIEHVDYRGKKDSELAPFSPGHYDAFMGCEASDEVAWQAGAPSRGDEVIPHPDLGLRVYDIIKIPVFFDDGRRRGLIVVGRDVTERRREEQLLKDSEAYNKALFNDSRIALGVMEPTTALFVDCNDAAMKLYRVSNRDDLLGRTPEDVSPAVQYDGTPSHEAAVRHIEIAVKNGSNIFPWRHRHQDGTEWDAEVHLMRLSHSGRELLLFSVEDVTGRKAAEGRLRLSAAVIASTRDGVIITDRDGLIVTVNHAFSEITGFSEEEAVGQNPRILQSGRHPKTFYQQMWQALQQAGHWQGEIWNRRKNGEVYPQLSSLSAIHDDNGAVAYYVAVFTDISRLKEAEQRLEHLAYHDPLTDLPNRALLHLQLDHALEQARRRGSSVALHLIDLDRFKDVNDGYGHPVGDELLVAIAGRLRKRLRREDLLVRLGGDEFVILQEDLPETGAAAMLARMVIDTLSDPFSVSGGRELYIGASIGIAVFPDDAEDGTTLLRNADAALYQAKAQGRNMFHYYTSSLTIAAAEKLRLEARMRRALELDQFVVDFQPQISLQEGRITGAEALVRWIDPEHGTVSPGEFIPAAEECGLIGAIGDRVLEASIKQMRRWMEDGIPLETLAINISPRQFRLYDVPERLADLLRRYDVPADRIELEITESALMEHGERAGQALQTLKQIGIRLAIDDFGTGYSSLAYLKRFPIDALKIDRSFVMDIPDDESDAQIAQAIIAMAQSLKLKVIAEGVETEQQRKFFKERNCNYAQGYLISPAIPADEFAAFVRSYSTSSQSSP